MIIIRQEGSVVSYNNSSVRQPLLLIIILIRQEGRVSYNNRQPLLLSLLRQTVIRPLSLVPPHHTNTNTNTNCIFNRFPPHHSYHQTQHTSGDGDDEAEEGKGGFNSTTFIWWLSHLFSTCVSHLISIWYFHFNVHNSQVIVLGRFFISHDAFVTK